MLLLAVVAIIVVVAVAAAAYVVLSNDDGGEKELAPGTHLVYKVSILEDVVTLEQEYIGQNADEYYIKTAFKQEDTLIMSGYQTQPKGEAEDMVKIRETMYDTVIDGEKNLEVWEYYDEDDSLVRVFIDPKNGLPYRIDSVMGGTPIIAELEDYDLKLQDSYEESDAIGTKYRYVSTDGFSTIAVTLECVADCPDNRYLVSYAADHFIVCSIPQGLPADAEDTGETIVLTDMGGVEAQIWTYTEGIQGFRYYYDPDSSMLYAIVAPISPTEWMVMYFVEDTE